MDDRFTRDALAGARAAWRRDGVVALPRLIDARARARWLAVCDRIAGRWRAARDAAGQGDDTTNLAYLTDPRWTAGRPYDLRDLLALLAGPFAAIAARISGRSAWFHNTQYFPEPRVRSWQGDWHRDCQFIRGIAGEDQIRAVCTGIHLRIALVDDDHLEVVPGSHARRDTPEEFRVRRDKVDTPLAGARRFALSAGDGLLFHAWSVHRGHYDCTRPRRTLDVIYGSGRPCPGCGDDCYPPPAPLCGLAPAAVAYHRCSRRRSGLFP